MCGRYTLARIDPAGARARFPLGETVEIRRRYNVAPGDQVLAVTVDEDRAPRGELLHWGLVPPWGHGRGPRPINARAETAAERPAFRDALRRFRCLIPADGFYEWRRDPDGRRQAFHITSSDGGPFAFAGLWSSWRGGAQGHSTAGKAPGGEELRSCAILTTKANDAVAPLHDRMPVILPRRAEEAWLDHSIPLPDLIPLLAPLAAADTVLRPVGPAVNDARYDGPECLAAPSPARQPALF